MRNVFFGGAEISGVLPNLGLALVRVLTGLGLMLAHGLRKFPPPEQFVGVVENVMGFPFPAFFAWCAVITEVFGGLLLALGLATRPVSLLIAFNMLAAGFIRHAADPFAVKEKALLYLVIAILFIFIGSGKYGLDELLRRKWQS